MSYQKFAIAILSFVGAIFAFEYHALAAPANIIRYPDAAYEKKFLRAFCQMPPMRRESAIRCLNYENLHAQFMKKNVNYNELQEVLAQQRHKALPLHQIFPDEAERAGYWLGVIESGAECRAPDFNKALLLFANVARHPNAAFSAGLIRLKQGKLSLAYRGFLQSAEQGSEIAYKRLRKKPGIDFYDDSFTRINFKKNEYLQAFEYRIRKNKNSVFCRLDPKEKKNDETKKIVSICGFCL